MIRTMLAVLVVVAACRPHVERRALIPTTDFCGPSRYNTPRWGYADGPKLEARNAATDSPRGLFVDGVLVADPRPDWGLFPSPSGYALADGRWLVVMGDHDPSVFSLQKRHWLGMNPVWTRIACLIDPANGAATLVDSGYWTLTITAPRPIW